MKLSSNFAMLDVRKGRYELLEHFRCGESIFAPCEEELFVPVTVHGFINGVCGYDDGVSIEYSLIVTDIETEVRELRHNPLMTVPRRG